MVPYIEDGELCKIATNFLNKYNKNLLCPIEIELIVEKMLGLKIFPIVNLEKFCDVSGGISKDFCSILIDERQYLNQEKRSRFTIAHEVGHLILHSKIFKNIGQITSSKNYIDFQNYIDSKNYSRLEIQANYFAEQIIFPKSLFNISMENIINSLGGVDSLVLSDLTLIISSISKQFGVTDMAAMCKIKRDFPSIFDKTQVNTPF